MPKASLKRQICLSVRQCCRYPETWLFAGAIVTFVMVGMIIRNKEQPVQRLRIYLNTYSSLNTAYEKLTGSNNSVILHSLAAKHRPPNC